jgi:hypothetical protein
MSQSRIRQITGLMLVAVPVLFTACFTILQVRFEYPDILRQPTAAVLAKFQAGGAGLIAVWYALTFSAILFMPLAVLVSRTLGGERSPAGLSLATALGVAAGLVQTLGFLRWPFLVPQLAAAYLAPAASPAQRETATLIFESFHRYAGVAIGEHLGFLCTAAWTFLVALAVGRSPLFSRWLGPIGALLALGIAAGTLEPLGWQAAGPINAVSYLAWALWLIVLGGMLLRRRSVAGGR